MLSQPDSDVILASNFGECEHIKKVVSGIEGVKLIDITGTIIITIVITIISN